MIDAAGAAAAATTTTAATRATTATAVATSAATATATTTPTFAGERPPIPLVVLGGYLGAGKTTLLNHVLSNAGQRRVAVLVNDFGDINIDAALIRERTDDVINLENGCVCCSIGGRLVDALVKISARPARPELLIIEASGVSDPVKIAQIGLLDRAFRL
jgi:Ni2+-binding GTPase involved in maturation of urease and hydrogenase